MSAAIVALTDNQILSASYRHCRRIARRRAKNFYYSFLLLSRQQRLSMCAIYAFMRQCDDLSDDPAASTASEAEAADAKRRVSERVALWRLELDRALGGRFGNDPLWPAFHDTVQRYRIPHRYFHEMMDGILSDLEPRAVESFEELYAYCYQVASVVGLTIIHIFGFQHMRALLLAEKCGVAFQLTNIMRDVREDAALGRTYLPAEDLRRFGVDRNELVEGGEDDRFRKLMAFEALRARAYYDESAPLLNLVDKRSRRSLWALRAIYLELLSRLEASRFEVLSRRINVPTRVKVGLLVKAWLRKHN